MGLLKRLNALIYLRHLIETSEAIIYNVFSSVLFLFKILSLKMVPLSNSFMNKLQKSSGNPCHSRNSNLSIHRQI